MILGPSSALTMLNPGHQFDASDDDTRYGQNVKRALRFRWRTRSAHPAAPIHPIGFSPASIAARRSSRKGRNASFSSNLSIDSPVAKPGPSVTISNRMPLGSRK